MRELLIGWVKIKLNKVNKEYKEGKNIVKSSRNSRIILLGSIYFHCTLLSSVQIIYAELNQIT